jgi:hypothetical protein
MHAHPQQHGDAEAGGEGHLWQRSALHAVLRALREIGLFALAQAHDIELVGGDTTSGPLTVCITVFGEVPAGTALLRSGARPGDDLWVSGALGDARLGLEVLRGTLSLDAAGFEHARAALEMPQPRVALGGALRGVATAAIDLSDGSTAVLTVHPSYLLRLPDEAAKAEARRLFIEDLAAVQRRMR